MLGRISSRGHRCTRMLKATLGRVVRVGVSPRLLVAHVAVLRMLRFLPQARVQSPAAIRRIFFSFPYHSVGDLILSLTLLERVHRRWPEAQIDVAIGSSMGAVVNAIPYVHRTFRLARSRIRKPGFADYAEICNATKLFRKEIADTAYDLTIAPRWDSADSFFSGYLAYLTSAPIRCGYSGGADGGSTEVDRFYTVAATGGAGEHESLRYTRLLGRCGLESVAAVDPDTPQHPIIALRTIVEQRKVRGEAISAPVVGRYAVISPGATNPRRMWPIARFAEIGRAVYQRYGLRAVVIGGPADIGFCEELSSAIGESALSIAGKTDSIQMLDIIAGADVFLGNDSGPAHIAGGLGIITIVISPFPSSCTVDHPNSPTRFRPAGNRVQVLQPVAPVEPCSPMCQQDKAHCILQVSSDQVLASISAEVDANRVSAGEKMRDKSVCGDPTL
jgi:heptosyltransferase III